LPVEGIGLDVIQAPNRGLESWRYELTDYEWAVIKPFLPNTRGVPRACSRHLLGSAFGCAMVAIYRIQCTPSSRMLASVIGGPQANLSH
jgi:hypothetical protein